MMAAVFSAWQIRTVEIRELLENKRSEIHSLSMLQVFFNKFINNIQILHNL